MYCPDRKRPAMTPSLAAVLLLAAFALLPIVAHAQWVLLGKPTAPTDLSPIAGTYEGKTANRTSLTMAWSQYFPSGGINANPPATHFVVCFDAYAGANPPSCSVATADWTETIAAPSSALTRTGNRFTLAPGRFITATELDVNSRLTVGACAGLLNSNCRYTSVDLFYSSRNPAAAGTGIDNARSTSSTWVLDVRATNRGTSDVQPFSGTVEYWEVLGVGNPGRACRIDVDSMDVRDDPMLFAFDVEGRHTLIRSLPRTNGVYTGPQIVGIYRVGSSYDMALFTTASNPSIPADVATSRSVGSVSFPVPVTVGLARTFVVVPRLDTNAVVREFNENDNTVGQCKLR